jgi:hypothetical protein
MKQVPPEVPYNLVLEMTRLHIARQLIQEGKNLAEVFDEVYYTPHRVEQELSKLGIQYTAAQ